jgi:hypothetical protein
LLLLDRVKLTIAVWFGLIRFSEMKIANQTAQFRRKMIRAVQNKYGFQFDLIRFVILLLDWFGYDHPYRVAKIFSFNFILMCFVNQNQYLNQIKPN